ncbi:MAG TPA: gamma carbonic anhydrase family protein [Candidatus Flavonifractor merdipullorum]|uniref:Gamma carbonic anhydrase family protein n=1 Tax=Candidatus Flavonifractor merdipullorum TaxID=2838590 RepID=A0A9D1RUU1_9FIRM|nr:gamma carbonic anhydrase family protein [Candidatus Flavonifractor merdipullorum]
MEKEFQGRFPVVHPQARVAETAVLVGDVQVDAKANIWYSAVLRGDTGAIRIGEETSIQDNVTCHCEPDQPLLVGKKVTVGHNAVIHGCTIEDRCLIGMGAILLNGCVIGTGSIVGAGALVTQNTVIPPGSLALGSPARVVRALRPEEDAALDDDAAEYQFLMGQLPEQGGA